MIRRSPLPWYFAFSLVLAGSAALADGGTFAVQIGGDTQAQLIDSADRSRFSRRAEEGAATTYQLWFGNKAANLAVSVLFYADAAPPAGRYPIGPATGESGDVTAVLVDNRDGLGLYDVKEGEIVLEKQGESYGGRFEFAAQGGPISAGGANKVTVSGTFEGVVLTDGD